MTTESWIADRIRNDSHLRPVLLHFSYPLNLFFPGLTGHPAEVFAFADQ